jgi:hypothetical protein
VAPAASVDGAPPNMTGAPLARRCSHRLAMAGASGVTTTGSMSSGGGTTGMTRSQSARPGRGSENAANARPIKRLPCSMRAEHELSERPARSIVVAISSLPSAGGAA